MKALQEAANTVKGFFNGEEEDDDTLDVGESKDGAIDEESFLEKFNSPFEHKHRQSTGRQALNGSQELTPGRRKTLRESGWDGVQGTHHQRKYRELEKLENSLRVAEENAEEHSGKRAQQFEAKANHLRERIQRQKNKIAAAEKS